MKSLKFLALAVAFGFMLSASAEEHLKSLNPPTLTSRHPPARISTSMSTRVGRKPSAYTEHARYGNFNILSDSSEARVKDIVLNLGATNPQPGSVAFKVWTIYSQAMDSVRRNAEGAKPILADLKKIETAPADSMENLFLWLHANYASPFFSAAPWRISPTARCMPCM